MTHRNRVRSAAFAVIGVLSLFSGWTVARSYNQETGKQTEASLMATGQGVPDAEVVLTPKVSVQPAPAPAREFPHKGIKQTKTAAAVPTMARPREQGTSKKTKEDGSFSFENVRAGTYNLTFNAPEVSPAMAGKVEYLVIVRQVEVGAADNPTAAITIDESKAKTARIPIARITEGFEYTVGPIPPVQGISASNSNVKKGPLGTGSQTTKATEAKPGVMTPVVNLRGKIFLVKIGTNIGVDGEAKPVKPNPNQQ